MTDWLTEFPLHPKPDAWDLNPIFLQKLKEVEALWAKHGFKWKFGVELEFNFLPYDDAKKIVSEAIDAKLFNLKSLSGTMLTDSFVQQAILPTPEVIFPEIIEDLRAYFTKDPDGALLLQQTGKTLGEVLADIAQFENDLKSDDPKKVSDAKRDIILAHMHINPFEKHGVRDLIEPRWGKAGYGIGWNDVRGPEIRTPVITGAFEAIATSHKFLKALRTASICFAHPLDGSHFNQQLHFSIWRESDGKNMMDMQDEESIAFCERVLAGYYYGIKTMPFIFTDYEDYTNHAFTVGVDRTVSLRLKMHDWEDRQGRGLLQSHITGQILIIMLGTAQACLDEEKYKSFKDEITTILDIKRRVYPAVEHRSGNKLSGLLAAIEHSEILPDGKLKPDGGVVERVLWRLKDEIGEENINAYMLDETEIENIYFNLAHPSVWMDILEKLRITPDNRLDTTAIGDIPVLVKCFDDLNITGRRTALTTAEAPVGGHLYQTSDLQRDFTFSALGQETFTPYEISEISRVYKGIADHAQHFRHGNEFHHVVKEIEKRKKESEEEGKKFDHSFTYFLYMYSILTLQGHYLSHLHNGGGADVANTAYDQNADPLSHSMRTQYKQFIEHLFSAEGMILEKIIIDDKEWVDAELFAIENLAIMFTHEMEKKFQSIMNGDFIRQHGPNPLTILNVCDSVKTSVYSLFKTVVQDTAHPAEYALIFIDALKERFNKMCDAYDDKPETAKIGPLSKCAYDAYKAKTRLAIEKIEEWANENIKNAENTIENKSAAPTLNYSI